MNMQREKPDATTVCIVEGGCVLHQKLHWSYRKLWRSGISLFGSCIERHVCAGTFFSFQFKPNATSWSDAHSKSRRVNRICALEDACCTQRGQSEKKLIQSALKANLINEHAAWKTWCDHGVHCRGRLRAPSKVALVVPEVMEERDIIVRIVHWKTCLRWDVFFFPI